MTIEIALIIGTVFVLFGVALFFIRDRYMKESMIMPGSLSIVVSILGTAILLELIKSSEDLDPAVKQYEVTTTELTTVVVTFTADSLEEAQNMVRNNSHADTAESFETVRTEFLEIDLGSLEEVHNDRN